MNEQDIFNAAIEIENLQRRAVFVEQACGKNLQLLAQVNSLLKSYDQSGEFLQVPALEQAHELNCPTITGDPATNFRGETIANSHQKFAFLDHSTNPASIGRLGHYEIQQLIGRGGCGIVFKAFDQRLHRMVAIKVMSPELAATSPARKRFLREARSTATIRHDNVVNIYAVEEQPIPYLVMEYVDGKTLQQLLDGNGPLDISDIRQIGVMIANGLQAAHQQGIIHRDIKPGNILIESGTGRACITDFGLARTADDASQTMSGGIIVGTPLYMSPEQARGVKLDQRSDLFSLGSVLYVMCCGRPPFRAGSTLAVLKRVAEENPRNIHEVIPEVPDWLVHLIQQLHAKNPADRPASALVVSTTLAHPPEVSVEPQSLHHAVPLSKQPTRLAYRPQLVAGVILLAGLLGLGTSEATGLTNLSGTVIRYFTPEGTLVIEVDDPGVSVSIDGEDMVITGAGLKELRMKPGQYRLQASKDGEVIQQELVTVSSDGRQVVRVSREENAAVTPSFPAVAIPAFSHSIWDGPDGIALTFLEQQGETIHGRLTIGEAVHREFRATLKDHRIAWQAKDVTAITGGRGANNEGLLTTDAQGDRIDFTYGIKGPGKDAPGMSGTFTVRRRKSSPLPETSDSTQRWTPTAEQQQFFEELLTLPNKEQVAATEKKLHEINPGYSGKLSYNEFQGVLSDLTVPANGLLEIWPVRGLGGLKKLTLHGSHKPGLFTGKELSLAPLASMGIQILDLTGAHVANLTPLSTLPLNELILSDTAVSDLRPLKGLPLVQLQFNRTQVFDLSPLNGMSLRDLSFYECPVVDLSPLQGMPLKRLLCGATRISDLSPLAGMKLEHIQCSSTQVSDLTPLQGMPLKIVDAWNCTSISDLSPLSAAPLESLTCTGGTFEDLSPLRDAPLKLVDVGASRVADISPLEGMQLTDLVLENTRVKNLEPLRNMPLVKLRLPRIPDENLDPIRNIETLRTINDKPAAEFWQEHP